MITKIKEVKLKEFQDALEKMRKLDSKGMPLSAMENHDNLWEAFECGRICQTFTDTKLVTSLLYDK